MTPAASAMLRLMDRAVTRWHFPVIGRDKARLLARVIARHRPRRAVEVGSLFGYSAIVIAGHLPRGGRLTCVEANPFLARVVEANLREAGLAGRAQVVVGDGREALTRLRGPIDLLFLDAAKDQYLQYLLAVEPRLAPGAVVVADNTGIFRHAVRPYLAHVRTGGRYRSQAHDFGDDAMEVSVCQPTRARAGAASSGSAPSRGRAPGRRRDRERP